MDPKLSVIVVTYKRGELLELCLRDLAAQDTNDPFEVIVVLQAYPAGAGQALRDRFGDRLSLVIAEFPDALGTARARNIGLETSRTEIVAFVDDDVRLPPYWARSLLGFYADESIGAVGGFVDHPGHSTPARNAIYRMLGLTSNRYRIDWGGFNVGPAAHSMEDLDAEWLCSANMSFRRSVVDTVGGFDENLGAFWHEDVDVTHRIARSGWRMISTRKMPVEHYPSPLNRPPLHEQMRERERSRVLFVWKAIGDKPLWRLRYGARLLLHAAAMSVVGAAKADPRIPINVLRGGWEGLRGLPAARAASSSRVQRATVGPPSMESQR